MPCASCHYFPHPCARTQHTQSVTNDARRHAPMASMRARHLPQASGASGRAAQHPQRLRGPLPTAWNLFATSIVSGARRDPKAQKRPRRVGRVRPRSSRQSLPRAGRSARVGCRANPRGEASPATCKRTVECREGVGASGRGGPWRGAGERLAERRHLASARGRTSLTIHRVSAPVDRLCRAANHGVTAANTYRLAGGARRLYYILWAARGPQLTSSPCARSAGRLNGGTWARWPQKTRAHAARADVAAVEA